MMVLAPAARAAWANASNAAGSNPGSGHTDAAMLSARLALAEAEFLEQQLESRRRHAAGR